ncbi:MAG: ArsR family transcriptional regulator [Desulfuromonadaceae bacterium GWC2_58_13]|nr:MAG: ArsR family transcriptional regulator [Desulfuromonadaceae bacterium GWC2_58_13]
MIDTFKALADVTRLRLVGVLSKGEFTVQELTSVLAMGQSRVSRHLKILSDAGILSVKRQGTWAYYRLKGDNQFFLDIWPTMEQSLNSVANRERDLERVSEILDSRRRRSLEFFDRHARQWDDFSRNLLSVPSYLAALLNEIPVCRVIVEVGVGTGNILASLSRKAPKVVGVDHSPAMLDEARLRVGQEGLAGIEFRLGEMSHLPLGDNEVDCLLLNMVLHHAALPERVFQEACRILAPGGRLVIADLQRHDQDWVRDKLADQWLGFERTELEAWLAGAGFSCARFVPVYGTVGQQGVFILAAGRIED